MTTSSAPRLTTPCIGICSSGIGDSVCRGCMRFAHEVNDWNAFSETERGLVLARLDTFLRQVMANWVEIFDAGLVAEALRRYRVVCDPARDPHRWLYDLLRRCASRIGDPVHCGFRLRPQAGVENLMQLSRIIERDWLALSIAHYERYVEPGLRRSQG